MLVREWNSDILNNTKQYSMDSFISQKFIYSETISIIADFLKKDHDAKRKLAKLSEGWDEITCMQLEEVPVFECEGIDIRNCEKLMRSKDKLPDTFTSSFGNIIKHVASINFSSFFDPVTPRQFNDIQKREFIDKRKNYYFFINGYIYIPVYKGQTFGIESIRIDAYFKSKWDVAQFNLKNSDCKDCQKDKCKSPLDFDLVIPTYLENDVKKELLNRLSGLFLKVQADQYPNMNNSPSDQNSQRDQQNQKS